MPTFASPGVTVRELDLSLLANNNSEVIPAFVGTAKKGPLNVPVLISNAEQYVETFDEPFPEANMGYSVIAFLEEGNSAWVMRVGVECAEGQAEELAAVCIDTSGARVDGWGRIPVFSGIDFGQINIRIPTAAAPLAFHLDGVFDIDYNDADVSQTDGPTVATLSFTGSFLSDTYIGSIDDNFTLLITGDPASGSTVNMAPYELIRGSDGAVIGSGLLVESGTPGISEPVAVGSGDDDTGLIFQVEVTGSSPLEQNDTFTFRVEPDNRTFSVEVEGVASVPASFTMPTASYATPEDFVTAFNTIVGAGVDFLAGYDETNLFLRTRVAGERIQLTGTEAFALEVGVQKWAWDIPRSHLLSSDPGPYNINSNNNRVVNQVISAAEVVELEASIPIGTALSPVTVANALNLAGVFRGERFYESLAFQVADDEERVLLVTVAGHQFDQLRMMADFSHIKTLRFAEEVGFATGAPESPQPTRPFRVFNDPRVAVPEPGVTDPSTPLSCEINPGSAQCAVDTAYYNNIVGFFVAPSPGTWLDGYTLNLESFQGVPGRYILKLFDPAGLEEPGARADNISFNSADARYVGNVLNPGSRFGGQSGNRWLNWEERPVFLQNDPNDATNFAVRQPGLFDRRTFAGMANGIPTDPVFAAELDQAVIGNSARSTGFFAFENIDTIDIALLSAPGFSSGSVIAAGLQLAEARGDTIFLVDPPFGLRPQQVVDWHNGMLFSDLNSSLNSSYGALYWSWVQITDQFNGGTIFVPPSGHVAAVYARTARDAEQWFAPAGLQRGLLRTVLDLEFNPTKGERDLLYGFDNAVNPLVNFPRDGIAVFGQRTLQRADSALDRVNVRMLLTFIKKGLQPILRRFVFEPNDQFLWQQVRATVSPFLADIQARRGLTAFKVVVDETNNTPERIDRNELWVSVWIKPTRAAEFVVLNLTVLRTDSSFGSDELLAAAGVVTVG